MDLQTKVVVALVVVALTAFGLVVAGALAAHRGRRVARREGVLRAWSCTLWDPRSALLRLAHDRRALERRPFWVVVGETETGLEVWKGTVQLSMLGSVAWNSVTSIDEGTVPAGINGVRSARVHVRDHTFEGHLDFAPIGWLPIYMSAKPAVVAEIIERWRRAAEKSSRLSRPTPPTP